MNNIKKYNFKKYNYNFLNKNVIHITYRTTLDRIIVDININDLTENKNG